MNPASGWVVVCERMTLKGLVVKGMLATRLSAVKEIAAINVIDPISSTCHLLISLSS